MLTVSVVGASGYVGGELIRILLGHPDIRLAQVTSRRQSGRPIHEVHPHLRGVTSLRFIDVDADTFEPCDVLFLALPHGEAAKRIEHWTKFATRVVDCSADFRLDDADIYRRWYGEDHPAPGWLERFVYGLPEVHRGRLAETNFASGVGCNATVVNLALAPLVRAGVVDLERPIVCEVKVGSSEGGASANDSSHHPERSGVVRSFAPVGHRHTAEVEQVLGRDGIHLSLTSVEMVRGALATGHVFLGDALTDRDLWGIYRECYGEEPFVRIVHGTRGLHRHPEPKILVGSNFADVGWSLDAESGRVVCLAAIDNLGKGAAGTAIQSMNLMCGFDERAGLEFAGLHPA